jgi:hypothetical protein
MIQLVIQELDHCNWIVAVPGRRDMAGVMDAQANHKLNKLKGKSKAVLLPGLSPFRVPH